MNDWTPRERTAFVAGFAYAMSAVAHGAHAADLPKYIEAMAGPLTLKYSRLAEMVESARDFLGNRGTWRCPSRSRDINEGGRPNHVDPGVRRRE